jgi:hypothetical protein
MTLEVSSSGDYEMKVKAGFIKQMMERAVLPAFVVSKRSQVDD